MSFEQRHRRQHSSADPSITKDEPVGAKGEDFDKTILHIQRKLDTIPTQYKQQSGVFNPLEQVIDMMKSSNLKERKKELDTNVRTLDKAMESVVKAHYDGFNKAIKNYTQILGLVTSTGTNNSTLSQNAAKCNALFTSRSHSVNTMYLQSLEYSYMIEILDKIEAIKKVPEQYQEAFNSQQYLQAAKILVDSVDKLYQDDLLKIGALVELQADIVSKKNTFHEVAIELLHNLIYLKDQPDLSEEANDTTHPTLVPEESRLKLNQLEAKDPLTVKLELMDQLVSAFFVLGKSTQAINKILERLRSELRHIIQKAVATVKKRYEKNPVLLQQILSRPPRGEGSHEYPNLFYDMLQIVFTKVKEIIIFHRCVTELFEEKMRQQQEANLDDDNASSSTAFNLKAARKSPSPAPQSSQPATPIDRSASSTPGVGDNSGDDSSVSTYRLDHVWEEFQKELQSLIGYWINAPTEGAAIGASSSKSSKTQQEPVAHQGTRLFSFSNSSAFTLYEVSETQSFQYRSMDLGEPSVYNLPAIYPLISTFCDLGSQIVGTKLGASRLQSWVDAFISNTLLATVKSDYKMRLESAVQSAEAFKSRDTKTVKSAYNADDARRPLLNSAVEVYHCVKELYEDSVAMPIYTSAIHGIMEQCLLSYYEQSKSKYEEYVKESEVGRTVKNPEFQKLVLTDPLWKRLLRLYRIGGSNPQQLNNSSSTVSAAAATSTSNLEGSENGASPTGSPTPSDNPSLHSEGKRSSLSSLPRANASDGHGSNNVIDHEETEYVQNLMDFEAAWHMGTTEAGVPINARHMILDPTRLANLGALHDSLFWIADKVALLDHVEGAAHGPPAGKKGGFVREAGIVKSASPVMSGSSTSVNAASGPAANRGKAALQRTTSNPHNKVQPAPAFHPKLSSSLGNLTWMFKDLSDQCLHNIYVDFRLQTCYFLDGINRNYVYAAEDRQPDARVVELNQSLSNTFQQLQLYLPPNKLKYLLGSLPTLMSSLLIESLKSHIEAVNRNGVVKMVRNVFALQQNLTGMTTFNEEPFDKVRRYYELLNLNIEEVYQFIAQHHHAEDRGSYTLNQYRTILELIANPKSRVLSDEQEKDLRDKYVLTPFQSESKRPVH